MPRGEGKLGEQVAAGAAHLAGREPAVNHDQVPSGRFGLVPDHAAEGTPPAVGDGPGERPVADHDPYTAERAIEYARLFDFSISPAPLSRPHDRILSGVNVMNKLTRARWERRFLPGLKAAVSTPEDR